MEQRIAIVTGGTGGIGTAVCRRLAKNFHVIACYFKSGDHDKARQWQATQAADGLDCDILYADVTSFDDCTSLANSVVERYGRVDILVNNAGITRDSTLKKMRPEQWQEVLNTNLTSVFNMTRNVLPYMQERSYGRIINISSINGRKGQFGQCNYAAAKSALFGFTKSLAQEVAKQGITVNTISPGYTATPMLTAMKQEILQAIIDNIPIGRLGRPEEIAFAVDFFAADEAGFITGANLDINGGQYM